MVRKIGRRSERKIGTSIKELPNPMNMALWKALRKRLAIPEGDGEVCIRNDPEFGLTPYTRRFGVEINPNVEAQNKNFASCANLIENTFQDVKIKYEKDGRFGKVTKTAFHTRFKIDNNTYYTTRDAVRYAMHLCRKGEATDTDSMLRKLKEAIEKGKINVYSEEEFLEKYPNAQIIELQETS